MGTGWDLHFTGDNNSLAVVWFTYASNRRPYWILSETNQINRATNSWSAQLYAYAWDYSTNSISFSYRVGSVALTFLPTDPTRAAISWQWDQVDQSPHNECIIDYFRQGPSQNIGMSLAAANANTTYSGFWYEPARGGWGMMTAIGQPTDETPSRYVELEALTLYDRSGDAVWIQGQSARSANAPPSSDRPLQLDYFTSQYPTIFPTADCTANCVAVVQNVGTVHRTFDTPTTGTANISVWTSNAATGPGITWNRPDDGVGSVAIQKITAADLIQVDRLQCTPPVGQTTCTVSVNWSSQSGWARAFRHDLATNAYVMLVDSNTGIAGASGERLDTLSAGQRVQYELHQTNLTSSPTYSTTPEVRALSAVASEMPNQAVESLDSELPAHDPTAGDTPFTASTGGGAAAIEIPITVPPGRRDMQPRLALSYSSRAGNGIAGLGTSLSGLSSIHRCPRTVEQDGEVRAVSFSGADRLCLDGQRLVTRAGSAAYGSLNASYATEIDSFVRVTQLGGDLTSPNTYFKVEYRDGQRAYFGENRSTPFGMANSRVTPAGAPAPLSWMVERREDRVGNTVTCWYSTFAQGENLIASIYYTGFGNSDRGTRHVDFSYTRRLGSFTPYARDQSSSYLSGSLTRQTQTLSKIATFVGTEAVREYRPQSFPSFFSGRGTMSGIQECAYSGTTAQCRPALAFGSSSSNYPNYRGRTLDIAGLPQALLGDIDGAASRPIWALTGDFDGDGAREMIVSQKDAGGALDRYLVSLSADRNVRGWYLLPANQVLTDLGNFLQTTDFDIDGRAEIPVQVGSELALSSWTPGGVSPNFGVGSFGSPVTTHVPFDAAQLDTLVGAADVNGDGLPDLILRRNAARIPSTVSGCDNTHAKLSVFLNTTTTPGSVTFASSPVEQCLAQGDGALDSNARVLKIADLDGDGLADIVTAVGDGGYKASTTTTVSEVFFSSRGASTAGICVPDPNGSIYKLCKRSWTSLFAGGPSAEESNHWLLAFWMDVNGDGLDDFVYSGARWASTLSIPCKDLAYCWTVRLNQGGTLGAAFQTASGAGLEYLPAGATPFGFADRGLIRVADIDADGRMDLLVPDKIQPFEALVCRRHTAVAIGGSLAGTNNCPFPQGVSDSPLVNTRQSLHFVSSGDNALCGAEFYSCPENPRTGAMLVAEIQPDIGIGDPTKYRLAQLKFANNTSGTPDTLVNAPGSTTPNQTYLIRTFANGYAAGDTSVYRSAAVRFFEQMPDPNDNQAWKVEAVELTVAKLSTLSPFGSTSAMEDIFGDGLSDGIYWGPCTYGPVPADGLNRNCAVPFADANGAAYSGVPQYLYGNPAWPVLSKRTFVSENQGYAARTPAGDPNESAPVLPDLTTSVTTGDGKTYTWDYFPLSSAAKRLPSETPFYALPALDSSLRYVDLRHYYFTSSMPAVSEMTRSDGIGGIAITDYSYRQAMYHNRGRGFRGFRDIVEEDQQTKVRTKTRYLQKFPFVGQIEQQWLSSMNRPDIDGMLRSESYTWGCNLGDRTKTQSSAECYPPLAPDAAMQSAGGKVYFPFLDQKESLVYDARSASDPSLPIIADPISRSRQINAPTEASAASGFDPNGNLVYSLAIIGDPTGSIARPGFLQYLGEQRATTATFYSALTGVGDWWLARPTQSTTTRSVTYGAAQPSPASAPAQTVSHNFGWNADGTPQYDALQSGVSRQSVLTNYAYPGQSGEPAGTNYGLPTRVTATADSDSNGSRSTTTAYSADGYFSATATIASGTSEAQTTQVTTQARDGQATLQVDPNGLRTSLQYDAFGQLVSVQPHGANDTIRRAPDKKLSRTICTSTFNCPGWTANVRYRVVAVEDGAPTVTAYLDAYGRAIKTETRLLDGTVQVADQTFDNRGWVAQQSEPRRSGETAYYTRFTGYDALGRVLSKTVPKQLDDGLGDLLTTYTYDGRQTSVRVCGSLDTAGAGCRNVSRVSDSLGRVVSTSDANTPAGVTKYWYDANGNALALQDAKGVNTLASYDAVGRRLSLTDPNMGAWSFEYDGLGELTKQTDARGSISTFAYDRLGRRKSRTSTGADATADGIADTVNDVWTWDAVNARGQLSSVQRNVTSGAAGNPTFTEKNEVYTYDSLARRVQAYTTLRNASGVNESFTTLSYYDAYYGRLKQQTYPSGDSVWLEYSKYGHPRAEKDAASGSDYRRVGSVNGRDQVTQETLGGSLTSNYAFKPTTGQMASASHFFGVQSLRALSYTYDVFGNVTSQANGATKESYLYDALFRVTNAARTVIGTGGASGTVGYGYDAVGNFTYKSDFSINSGAAYSYQPGSNKIASVNTLAAGTVSYAYDANGNLRTVSGGPDGAFSAFYDADNKPVYLYRGGASTTIAYGPDGEKVREAGSDGTRLYVGGYEKWASANAQKVGLGDYGVITRDGGGVRVDYLLKDRLGSADTIATATGAIKETRGYDAFGTPRPGNWGDTPQSPLYAPLATTEKGFTGHEQLYAVKIAHMGGRAYDYRLGRFLSVDPIIQFPTNSQSLNPYSYILNNPLSGTDPTGYAVSVESSGCTAMTGSHVCGVDTGAQGGATSKSFTLRDDQGGVAHITETVGGHGERSFSGSWNPGNGARGQSAVGTRGDGSKEGASEIEGARHAAQHVVDTAKTAMGAGEAALNPCPGTETAGGCAAVVAGTAVVGAGVGYAGRKVYSAYKEAREFAAVARKAGREDLAAEIEVELAAQGRKYWTRTADVGGIKVYQRNDLIDIARMDIRGRTNLQRMEAGLAPIGPDGKSMNLHHTLQTMDGPIAEMTQTFHQEYSRVMHINPSSIPSGINREAFDAWRADYWRLRASDFQ